MPLASPTEPQHTRISNHAQTANPLVFANMDLDNLEERHAFYDALLAKGAARVQAQLSDYQQRGIIDASGNPIATELPTDMLDDRSSVEQ